MYKHILNRLYNIIIDSYKTNINNDYNSNLEILIIDKKKYFIKKLYKNYEY